MGPSSSSFTRPELRAAVMCAAATATLALALACSSYTSDPGGGQFAHDTIDLATVDGAALPVTIGVVGSSTHQIVGGLVAGAFVAPSFPSPSASGPCTYSITITHQTASADTLSTVTGSTTCLWFSETHAEATFDVESQSRHLVFEP